MPALCPYCAETFPTYVVGRPVQDPQGAAGGSRIPVVSPVSDFDSGHALDHQGPTSTLIGLALLPLGIPLLWLGARLVTGIDPVFTYFMPVAIGLGVAGACLGAVFTQEWSHAGRVRAILILVLLGYGSAAFLYCVQKEWLETVRKRFGNRIERWQKFEAEDKSFFVQVPGKAQPDPNTDPLPGWSLKTYRCMDPKLRNTDVYVIAYGTSPDTLVGAKDDAWFAAAKEAILQASGAADPSEKEVTQQGHSGREFALVMPDRITNRTVRVFRLGKRVYYLAVDGAALPPDAKDVRKFFDSFYMKSTP